LLCTVRADALGRNGDNMPKKRAKAVSLPIVEPDAAGADIGSTQIFVAVPPDRDSDPVRCFETFTADLEKLADWLQQCRIRTIAMESTGVYWIPLFQILERRKIEVRLVNAHHVKNVPGKEDGCRGLPVDSAPSCVRVVTWIVPASRRGLCDSIAVAPS